MRRRLLTCALLPALGCGVQEIELAPDVGDMILQGDVPRAAVEVLARTPPGNPEPRLSITDPLDGSAIPGNLAPLTFRFKSEKKPTMMEPMMMAPMMKPGGGAVQAFELTLRAGAREVHLYTREDRAALPATRWQSLLDVPSGTALEVQLQALQEDGRVVTSAPVTIALLAPLQGRFAYWSETRGRALSMGLDQADAQESDTTLPALEPWESWHESSRLVAIANEGALRVTRAEQELTVTWASAWRVDQPAWLPDASALIFVGGALDAPPAGMKPSPMPPPMLPPEPAPAPGPVGLMRARWLDAQTLSPPEPLLESDKADDTLRSPSPCPGRALVFERSKGKDAVGKLWVIPSEGGDAAELGTQRDWKSEGSDPSCLAGGAEGELWVAFSQARLPGDEKLEPNQMQLWLVAAQEGPDGRLAATHQPVWLPQQRVDESNRRLLWVSD